MLGDNEKDKALVTFLIAVTKYMQRSNAREKVNSGSWFDRIQSPMNGKAQGRSVRLLVTLYS